MASLSVDHPGWVGLATVLELIWVLRSKNRFDRRTIAKTIDQLLSRQEIVVEQAETVQGALRLFRDGKADFADCLIALSAKAAGCSRTVTFDRIAARDAVMELLSYSRPLPPSSHSVEDFQPNSARIGIRGSKCHPQWSPSTVALHSPLTFENSSDLKTGDNIDFVEIEKGRFAISSRTSAVSAVEPRNTVRCTPAKEISETVQ